MRDVQERFAELDNYRTSSKFSEAERAALAFAEEATRNHQVSDETWTAVKRHFTDKQIVELVWLNATENFFNLSNAVLGIGSDDLVGKLIARRFELCETVSRLGLRTRVYSRWGKHA